MVVFESSPSTTMTPQPGGARCISTAVPGVQRHYDSGRALLQDVVDARVWLGFHFRFADIASRDLGRQLTAWTLDHYFQPVHEER